MNRELDPLYEDPETTPEAALLDEPPSDAAAAALPIPLPPLRLTVSGRYQRRRAPGPIPVLRLGELRLDVDGRYPQMTASGVVRPGIGFTSLHWVATLRAAGVRTWTGDIWTKDGDAALMPHVRVKIVVTRAFLLPSRARVTFSGGPGADVVHEFDYIGPTFDPVNFEFDSTPDANPALTIDTHAHPNRPASLPSETLSIESVFRRAGFGVTVTPPGPPVALGAGVDGVWSETEMHDAMQAHWQLFGNKAQWAMWIFHAALSDQGTGLGGIMFDDIGPNHRQGTAIFTESFIKNAPAGDPAAAAWVQRMRLWTAVHEMGHAFNLAHSWQKALGTPWVPLVGEPEARSFMNYPFRVAGGQTAFFSDFEFRFSDRELLFMRHAPRRFVQMGNADWFDHHGFEDANTTPEPPLRLTVRVNSDQPALQFMEPAMIEVEATNISGQPMLIDDELLAGGHGLTLIVKRDGRPARLWQPFSTECRAPVVKVLAAGESVLQPVFVGAGKGGWLIAEPGVYTVQASVRLDSGEDVVSAPLRLRVAPPAGYEEEYLAQDLFTQDVARVLAFDGTRQMQNANQMLVEVADRLKDRKVCLHANVALGLPLRRPGKLLVDARGTPQIEVVSADPAEARKRLDSALLEPGDTAAATLGHVEYREYVETYTEWLAEAGDLPQAQRAVDQASRTLSRCAAEPSTVAGLQAFGDHLAQASSGTGAARSRKRASK